ncbi:MAG: tetratricopeptide repeat protein [SAR324 cluster bacterium]|nr:tetratricopeptide repeat protein [SAR324 cluster bacterium]
MNHNRFIVYFFLLLIVGLSACAPQVTYQVKRPPAYPVENIEFVAVDSFAAQDGQIALPKPVNKGNDKDLLKPVIQEFVSDTAQAGMAGDLARANLVSGLSTYSPYRIINTTGEQNAFTGVLPEASKTALIRAKVKYSETIFERNEKLKYVLVIHNRKDLASQLMSIGLAAGAHAAGAGFEEPTPYVEIVGAMEVEFELLRQSDLTPLLPNQTLRAYYVRKWGGESGTSHVPETLRNTIVQEYQGDEAALSSLLSDVDKARLALDDPDEYLAKGYGLKRNFNVPLTPLDVKVRLARQVTQKYLKMISSYEEPANLTVMGGDDVAATLIKGNAYEEAIVRLQGLPGQTFENTYNLALAYEASGQFSLARQTYEDALRMNPGDASVKEAMNRLKNSVTR